MIALAKQQAKLTHLPVMGDFNMPDIDYNDYSAADSDFSFPMRFFDLSQDLFLIQHMFQATRLELIRHHLNRTTYLPMKKI